VLVPVFHSFEASHVRLVHLRLRAPFHGCRSLVGMCKEETVCLTYSYNCVDVRLFPHFLFPVAKQPPASLQNAGCDFGVALFWGPFSGPKHVRQKVKAFGWREGDKPRMRCRGSRCR
jgi:hypothetical protein